MKKIFLLIINLTLIGNISCQIIERPSYVSKLFETILSKVVQTNIETRTSNSIFTTNDNELFVMNNRGFANQKGKAELAKFNIFTGGEEIYAITPSSKFIESGENNENLWVWSIAVLDSLLFIAIDKEIWTYQLTNSMQYEYISTIALENVFRLEIDEKNLHAFIDNDDGFDWYKINLINYEIKKVRTLVLKNRLFLQISPVQVISIKNNALYFLQQNKPAIEKYSLNGDLIDTYNLKIPNWKSIPEEITNKLDSIKNTAIRSYAILDYSIFDYNFMLLFYVLHSERFFLMAINKESADGFANPYFVQIVGDTTFIEPFSVKLNEEEKFGEKYFPFLTPRAEGNIVFAVSKENMIQINRRTNVSWNNKTDKEFQHDVNLYYRDNEPITKIETYNFLNNYISIDSLQFFDYDDQLFLFKDIQKEKAIFIVSQQPQCSVCIKAIWNYFSKKLLPQTELYNVAAGCPTYLSKKENIKEVNAYLKSEYTPLFIYPKTFNSATKHLLMQKGNPIVVLFDKKKHHIEVISINRIIADYMGNITPSFKHIIDNFVGK